MSEGTVEAALEAFAEFAEANVDEHGWTDGPHGCQRERIVDWFGPSDFRAARDALAALRSRGSSDRAVVEAAIEHARQLAARFTGLIPPERPAALVIVGKIDAHLVEILDVVRGSSDARLTEALRALEEIKERSVCVIRGSIVSKHSGRFCAYHVASNALVAARADAPQEQQA